MLLVLTVLLIDMRRPCPPSLGVMLLHHRVRPHLRRAIGPGPTPARSAASSAGVRFTSSPIRAAQSFTLRNHPFRALPRLDSHQEHRINLLQALPTRFRQEEINHQHSDEVACREEVPITEADIARDERGRESDEEIEEPVARGTERDTCTSVA